MQCPSCEETVREGAHFCPSCGTPLAAAEPTAPITAKGTAKALPPLPPSPTAIAVATEAAAPGAPPSNTRWIVVAAVGAAVVALLVVVIVVVASSGGDDVQTATTGTTAPPGPTVSPATTAPPTEPVDGSGSAPTVVTAQPVDREEEAHQEIERLVAEGEPRVDAQMLDRWVPQLSAKKLGLVADNITYTYQDILNHFTELRQQYGDVLIINSSDYVSFQTPGFYIALAPQSFGSSAEALGWCAGRGLDNNRCYAKVPSHTNAYNSDNPGATTAHPDDLPGD